MTPSTDIWSQAAVEVWRERRQAEPLRPYDTVLPLDKWTRSRRSLAEMIVGVGWELKPFPPVSLHPPIAWDEVCAEARSWTYHLHCWHALSAVLCVYDHDGDKELFDFALGIAMDWARQYPTVAVASTFAWYDMAVGLRAYRLGYILDVAARTSNVGDDDVQVLLDSVSLHAEVLRDDKRFAGHNNHGFFQAAGQLALAARFPEFPWALNDHRQAVDRVSTMVDRQFAADGGHLEHSPEYHYMVWKTFAQLLDTGLVSAPDVENKRAVIEEALSWLVTPRGTVPLLGDSSEKNVEGSKGPVWPGLVYVMSAGDSGKPPQGNLKVFPQSGYAIIRHPWAREDGTIDRSASYLVQLAAFHSRTHKHADHLTFVWEDRGREILVDSGRYGYVGRTKPGSPEAEAGFWYSDPKRMYVESTAAHNTVEIDGRDFPRRGATPFGSAITRAGESSGLYFVESEVRHFRTIRHHRVLVLHPGGWLLVFDWLWDNLKETHTYTQRFHFAPSLEVVGGDDPGCLQAPLSGRESLVVVPLLPSELVEPARGQTSPRLLGWISRQTQELEPCFTAAFEGKGAAHTFGTLFTFAGKGERVSVDRARANTSGRKSQFRWTLGNTNHDLRLERPAEGDVSLEYETTVR